MKIEYLTIRDAAKILGVTAMTLRNWEKKGKLMAYRNPMNNYRVYRRDQLEKVMRKMENTKNATKGGRKIDIRII